MLSGHAMFSESNALVVNTPRSLAARTCKSWNPIHVPHREMPRVGPGGCNARKKIFIAVMSYLMCMCDVCVCVCVCVCTLLATGHIWGLRTSC
jgi:hypothetical protein